MTRKSAADAAAAAAVLTCHFPRLLSKHILIFWAISKSSSMVTNVLHNINSVVQVGFPLAACGLSTWIVEKVDWIETMAINIEPMYSSSRV